MALREEERTSPRGRKLGDAATAEAGGDPSGSQATEAMEDFRRRSVRRKPIPLSSKVGGTGGFGRRNRKRVTGRFA